MRSWLGCPHKALVHLKVAADGFHEQPGKLGAGHTNFSQWAGGVLGIDDKYVFELVRDAARIRAVSELGPELTQHLTMASSRQVIAEVIADHGMETARSAVSSGLADAAEQGKRRPTAAMLKEAARRLTAPAIPTQVR